MKKITCLFLLISFLSFSQVKIDSLGYHLGEKGYYVVDAPKKTAPELYKKSLDYINKTYDTPDKVVKAKTENSYLRCRFFDGNMTSIKRGGIPINIGGYIEIEVEFKDDKFRFKSFVPELFVNPDDVTNRLAFQIKGGMLTNSFYTNKLKLKREVKKNGTKNKLESYFNKTLLLFSNFLTNTETEKW
ncbi:MAG: hypothetical protein L3J20_10505 [Flavobacteriaceae bacterium]|nr:hypothetical protein [Flavobacteriaceae bacterium]